MVLICNDFDPNVGYCNSLEIQTTMSMAISSRQGDLINDYYIGPILQEVFETLKERENAMEWRPKQFKFLRTKIANSKKGRTYMVRLTFSLCEKLKVKQETSFLAVNYFDRIIFSSKRFIGIRELASTGLMCLQLAIKMNHEYETFAQRLWMRTGNPTRLFKWVSYPLLELKLLQELDWRLNVPTAVVCLSIYTKMLLVPQDEVIRCVELLKRMFTGKRRNKEKY